jgi:uncharacterized delta-60 repeat protein
MGADQSLSSPGVATTPRTVGLRVGGGRYQLKRMLGRGSFSEVWLAWSRTREEDVALRCLPQNLADNARLIERLEREILRVAKLSHPAIVPVYDFVQDEEEVAVAMQYIEGWSLAALKVDRPQKRYTIAELRPWLRHLCEALDYAHREGAVVHGDLKPANLLLDAREQLRITDFGVTLTVRSALAKQGQLIPGGLAYLSPQQAQGDVASVADDVYALGAAIYDLLTGTPPFFKGDLLEQVRNTPPPPMTGRLVQLEMAGAFPEAWERTVAACLAKDPAQRPQSAGQVLEWLERKEPLAVAKPVEKPQPDAPAKKAETPVVIASGSPAAPAQSESSGSPELSVPPAISPAPVSQELPAVASVPAPAQSGFPLKKVALLAGSAVLLAAALTAGLWYALGSKRAPGTDGGVAAQQAGAPGSLDHTFNPGLGADNEIHSLAVQPDGKLLVGGRFSYFDESNLSGVARLNQDGTPVRTFAPNVSGTVHAIALQPDGRILLGGDFRQVGGNTRRCLARLESDGSLDASFTPQGNLNHEVRALLVQPDGRILVGGSFTGNGQNCLTRFNADGSRDESFNTGEGANRVVWALALQPDGKILVGGAFTAFAGHPHRRLVRLNQNGSVDEGFDTNAGADNNVVALWVQRDGKILAGGDFTSFGESNCSRLVRLLPDGRLDAKFNTGVGANHTVRGLAV